MYGAFALLNAEAVVLDLGCGRGSFAYGAQAFSIVAMDVSLPAAGRRQAGERIHYVQADSGKIPLAEKSVDMVVSHHTMEHFPDYRATLSEIGRILKPDGLLWIAVPDGYSFDDGLYRTLFAGGGHVNRFNREVLTADVLERTGLAVVQSCTLYSGFVYLKKPDPDELRFYPPAARALDKLPEAFLNFGVMTLNTVTRVADKLLGTHLSRYGWGLLFARGSAPPEPLTSFFNVCRRCGSGSAAETLLAKAGRAVFGLRFYACPHCGERNVLVPPAKGTL